MTSDAWLGKTLEGRYVVQRFIGRGGMGAVYEAAHTSLDRKVAIKFLARRDLPDDERERFRREARLASRVLDDHVAQVFDIGATPDGDEYIVMEYVEGRDLGSVLRDGALEPARAIALARDILQGLAAIHEQGIVHRDVKPSNVLVVERGGRETVKLVDFGIARRVGDRSLTRTGHVVGTAQFMAPEQFRGEAIDARADLYAVGVTLYAMLAGTLPFDGRTAELAGQHVYAAPPALEQVRPGLAPSLVATVMRALEKAPADRFADSHAFIAALDGKAPHARAPVISYSAPTLPDRPARRRAPVRRSRWPWLVALATVIAGGVTGVVLARRDRAAAPGATPAEPVATPTPARDASSAAEVVAVAVVDAGVIADAGAVAVVAPPAVAAKKQKSGVAAEQRCQCIPVDGPDVVPMCPSKGTSLCRCDDARGKSLCAMPLIHCTGEMFDNPELRRHRRTWSETCHATGLRCPDLEWDRFARPGAQGAACTGYRVFEAGEANPRVDDMRTGHLNCDHCPGANTQTYRGRVGARCVGYHWRTGKELAGTLANCE